MAKKYCPIRLRITRPHTLVPIEVSACIIPWLMSNTWHRIFSITPQNVRGILESEESQVSSTVL